MQHSPSWLLHPHPILTRAHTDQTLTHLQTTEPHRPTVPDTALCREDCWLQSDAARSRFPGGGGEAGRQLETYNHQERGEKSSLSPVCSFSLRFNLISKYSLLPLQLRTSKWQSCSPSHAQSSRPSRSERSFFLFNVVLYFMLISATTAGLELIFLLSTTFLLWRGRKGKVVT